MFCIEILKIFMVVVLLNSSSSLFNFRDGNQDKDSTSVTVVRRHAQRGEVVSPQQYRHHLRYNSKYIPSKHFVLTVIMTIPVSHRCFSSHGVWASFKVESKIMSQLFTLPYLCNSRERGERVSDIFLLPSILSVNLPRNAVPYI